MSAFVIQGIGFVAMAAFIISYQIKSNRALYLCQLIGSALFCLQFFLLDAASGCLSLALNIVRSLLLLRYNEWRWVRSKAVPLLLVIAFALVLRFTWAGPVSLLAFVASAVSTVGYFSNNARTIRLSNLLVASPCWIVYDLIVGSWGGAVSEIITISSILISIRRFGWQALGAPNSRFQQG
ncbi:MAG: YgjV family protein [Firmicutes bacterium]|nr:YgjV family protein [Bacillota bacterium]